MNEFVEEHSAEILHNAYCEIENQLYNSSDMSFLTFLNREVAAGRCEHDDLIEIGGYRKGLKTAKEIIHRALFIVMDLNNNDTTFADDKEIAEYIRGKIESPY